MIDSMIRIIVFAITALVFIIVLKENSPHIAVVLTLVSSVILFLFILPFLQQIIIFFKSFSTYTDYKTLYLDVVLKIICIAYISEIASELCKDAGINSIATKIELGGKVIIMCLSLPIINQVLNTVIMIL